MENEIKWIGKELPVLPHHRAGHGFTQKFIEQLKTRPDEWAVYKVMPPKKLWCSGSDYRLKFPGTVWAVRTIDGQVHVFGKWVGTQP